MVMKEEEDTGLEEHIKKMVTIRRKALENIQVAQKRQKTQYDAKHSQDKAMYKVGTLVLVKNSRKLSRKGSKMAPNWFGPYCIHEVLKKGTFRLSQAEDDKKVLTQIYNITRLKLYYQRQAADENSLPCDPPLQSTSDSTQMPLTQATTDCTQMPLTPATSDSTQMPSKQATSDSTQMPLTQATSDSTQMPLNASHLRLYPDAIDASHLRLYTDATDTSHHRLYPDTIDTSHLGIYPDAIDASHLQTTRRGVVLIESYALLEDWCRLPGILF